MTIASTPIINSYIGNGATNSYPFNFVVFQATDIAIVIVSPFNVNYTLTYGIDFTVSGLNPTGGPPSTGSITLVSAGQAWLTGINLTTAWTLTITRTVIIQQATSIRNQGDFYQETIESALDYLTMILQQLQVAISSPVFPGGTTGAGDFTTVVPGRGLICVTPDGTKSYRISIANNGAIDVQQIA